MLSDSPYGGRKLRSLRGQSIKDAWLQCWPSGSAFFSFLFFFPAAPCGFRDLSSPTRDQTCAPCSGSAES